MATTVHVSGISHETSEKEVRDFFSFCGKINNLSITPTSADVTSEKSATVTFEKETAAKTALLLDNTQLGKSQVKVTSASTIDDVASKAGVPAASAQDDHIDQEDKPKSRILAEYLAHGYALSDTAIERALAFDKKGGYTSRFTTTLQNWDTKMGASDKAKEADAKYQLSNKAMNAWSGLSSYFEKAKGTPTGQRLHQFYLDGDKQVRDVHNEARRLADLKAEKPATEGGKHEPVTVEKTEGLTACGCSSDAGVCGCTPGHCSCKGCSKATPEHTTEIREAAQATGQQLPTGSV